MKIHPHPSFKYSTPHKLQSGGLLYCPTWSTPVWANKFYDEPTDIQGIVGAILNATTPVVKVEKPWLLKWRQCTSVKTWMSNMRLLKSHASIASSLNVAASGFASPPTLSLNLILLGLAKQRISPYIMPMALTGETNAIVPGTNGRGPSLWRCNHVIQPE